MRINGVDIANFKAKLLDRNISSADFSINNYWGNSLLPTISAKYNHTYKMLSLKFDVICSNSNELETMKSNLCKQLEIATIVFDDINKTYIGFCDDVPSYSYVMPGNEIMEANLLVYCYGEEKSEMLNRLTSKTINVVGNQETPCIVEITPSISLVDLIITGLADDPIIIKNLTADKKIIINGEDGTVLENGINKFGDTDLWEWPRLKAGSNSITVSKNSCDITIKYKPRYI